MKNPNYILSFNDFVNESIQSVFGDHKLTMNFNKSFPSGRYKLDPTDVDGLTELLTEFSTKYPTSQIVVNITSSESRVTNRDVYLANRPVLPVGELATRRANELKSLIEKDLTNLTNQGKLTNKFSFTINKLVGTEPYKRGDNVNDPKFTKDQFVKVVVSGTKSEPQVDKPEDWTKFSVDPQVFYNSNDNHLWAMGYYSIEDPGHTKVLLKSQTGDGEMYLIPSDWFNNNIHSTLISPQVIADIQAKFNVKNQPKINSNQLIAAANQAGVATVTKTPTVQPPASQTTATAGKPQ